MTMKSQIARTKKSPMMNEEALANVVLLHDKQTKLAVLPQHAAGKQRNALPKSTSKSGSFQPAIDKMDEFTEGDPKVLKTEQNYELLQPEEAGMQISLHEYIMNQEKQSPGRVKLEPERVDLFLVNGRNDKEGAFEVN